MVRDDYRKIYEYFSGADLSLAWPAISRSFAVTGNVRYRGEMMEIGVTLGNFAAALQGERSALKVRIGGAPFKFAFDGAMATRPTLKIEGATSADSPSLRRALQWVGKKPLPGGGFERFSLKAQTNVVGGTIALSSVNLELDGNAAEGVLTFAADGRQTLQGTLAADELNLTPYLSTIRLHYGAGPRMEPRSARSRRAADRRSRSAAVRRQGHDRRRQPSAAPRSPPICATAISASPSARRAASAASLRGTIGLARTEQGAVFTSQINFEDVNLEKCIGDLFGVNRIEGRGNLAITLEGTGNSVYAITRTLDGEASLTGTKGALTGLNVEQLLRRLERRPLSGGNEFRSGRTPFETLSVQVKVAKGQATVEEVTLKSPGVQLEIAGAASIPGRDLDLKGVATLVATSSTDRKSFELPFVVQGPWDDPLMLPDAQILIQRSGAAAPLLDALRGRNEREAARPAARRAGCRRAARAAKPKPSHRRPRRKTTKPRRRRGAPYARKPPRRTAGRKAPAADEPACRPRRRPEPVPARSVGGARREAGISGQLRMSGVPRLRARLSRSAQSFDEPGRHFAGLRSMIRSNESERWTATPHALFIAANAGEGRGRLADRRHHPVAFRHHRRRACCAKPASRPTGSTIMAARPGTGPRPT